METDPTKVATSRYKPCKFRCPVNLGCLWPHFLMRKSANRILLVAPTANHEGANHVFFPCEVPGRKKHHGWVHDPSAGGCSCDIWESRWSPRRWCCYHKWMAMSQQVQHCLGNQHCPMKGWPYSKVEPANSETSSSTSPKFMAVTVSGKWKTEGKHLVYSIDGQISVAKWDY